MGSWIVGTIVLAAVILAARKVYHDRKSGGCPGGCGGCTACPKGQSGEQQK